MIHERARHRGALLGLAAGDAVGTTVEFSPPGSFARLTDMVGGGPFGLAPGQWTDDTSMALCLGESLLERGGFDPVDQPARYVRWWRQGHRSSTGVCFDIGNTVASALERFERTGDGASGSTDPRTAGNGSLMRLAPAVLFYARDPDEAVRRAGESSITTHGAREAVDACRFFASLLVEALGGARKEDVLAPKDTRLGLGPVDALAPAIAAIAKGSYARKEPPEIRGTGYVVAALEAALWAVDRATSFQDAILRAANLGDDADTTAAIAGQLAGALWGEDGIPAAWRLMLTDGDGIVSMADALYERSTMT